MAGTSKPPGPGTAGPRAPLRPVAIEEYHVFLASPLELRAEREIVRQFFQSYNRLHASPRGCRFEVVDYENYATRGIGRAQDLITADTLEQYKDSLALVIGLMGQRCGVGSDGHTSGTEEEFAWAMDQNRQTGWPEIKWFFWNGEKLPVSTDPAAIDDDVEQWKRVCSFRERLSTGEPQVSYATFEDTAHLGRVLEQDLARWLQNERHPWMRPRPAGTGVEYRLRQMFFEIASNKPESDRPVPFEEFVSEFMDRKMSAMFDGSNHDWNEDRTSVEPDTIVAPPGTVGQKGKPARPLQPRTDLAAAPIPSKAADAVDSPEMAGLARPSAWGSRPAQILIAALLMVSGILLGVIIYQAYT